MFRHLAALSIVSIVSVVLVGCQGAMSIKVRRPSSANLVDRGRVAVLPLETGPGVEAGAEELTFDVSSALRKAGVQLVDRAHLDKRLGELEIQRGASFDAETSARLGKSLGAVAMVTGRIEQYQGSVTREMQTIQDKQVEYVKGHGHLAVYLQVVDVETGEILHNDNYVSQPVITPLPVAAAGNDDTAALGALVSALSGNQGSTLTEAKILQDMRSEVTAEFVDDVVATTETIQMPLHANESIPELEQGNRAAGAGRWPLAIEKYEAALEKASASAPTDVGLIQFNLGVAYTFADQFAQATKSLDEALMAVPASFTEAVQSMQERLERRRSIVERLRERDKDSDGDNVGDAANAGSGSGS